MLTLSLILTIKELHLIQVSDLHGWIGGHRHELNYGDLGTIESYVGRVRENISKNIDATTFFVDGGDICEGTGFSDGTNPRCMYGFQALSNLSLDLTTVGNHDLGSLETFNYFLENTEQLFGPRMITTNIQFNGQPLIKNRFKYDVKPNGLRILSFAFLYMGDHTYNGAEVINQTLTIRTPEIQQIIDEYGPKTDVLVLNCHIASREKESNEVFWEMRKQFKAKFNYEVPIILITAHSHQTHTYDCLLEDGSKDANCYNTEAGCYGRNVMHVVYGYSDIEYTFNGATYKGMKMASRFYFNGFNNQVSYIDYNTGKDTGLAARFNKSAAKFETDRGIELRKQFQKWETDLGLNKVIGYSKYKYMKRGLIAEGNSMQRLWMYSVYPNVVYRDDSDAIQYAVSNTGSIRDNMFIGPIFRDDIYTIMPFPNFIYYFPKMLGEEVNCVVDKLNYPNNDPSSNPKFLVPYRAEEGKYYDVLSDDYNYPRLAEYFAPCSKRGYNEQHKVYTPKTVGVTSTDQVLKYFVENYMQNPDKKLYGVSKSNSDLVSEFMWSGFIICGLIVASVVLAIWK
ncbi:5'_nucleotidase family protein [Hexamita inflata]|uniref:5' nucleotidase family protein n=1 Tax=Hexamita inflata TaxID=28002 RepID=A0AA86U9E9_9EUKA|nr:5' nucleotidase family protein [Hexamita inflata]